MYVEPHLPPMLSGELQLFHPRDGFIGRHRTYLRRRRVHQSLAVAKLE
jgi:hypothetical protein